MEFSGLGSEYFRIWIVNLLLIMVTFGIYYPWAKVRKLKYFYNNTRIDDHALEFHATGLMLLRGYVLGIILFSIFSTAIEFSALSGLIASVILAAVSPVVFRGAQRFRMANTSWRGMRMRFVLKDLSEAYKCVMPAALLFLLPTVMSVFVAEQVLAKNQEIKLLIGLAIASSLTFFVTFPYFFWRIKRLQHSHFAWGPLKTEYRSEVGDTYKIFAWTLVVAMLIAVAFAVIVFALIPNSAGSIRKPGGVIAAFSLLVPLFFLFAITINILPRAYLTAKMQNLLWSRTGNRHFRFKSELATGKFIVLQFKNYFLILITLGLYWPFAVVATQRMKLEAISLKTRVALDKLTDAARARENDAAGDMAADIFGFDVGM
ncbi:YjgN family protein [Variovorax sp. PCZ-1]|uniref:YjgN family protein n=1 Tax=Variovorax sp. PCZ-1 TaxID=2835533 RepID=UPI001BCF08B3|nr:DUF898 domain-containing protein [Variovorax sp. PCZ-1]